MSDYPIVGYRFQVIIFTAAVPNPVDIYFKEVSGLKVSRSISRQNQMTTMSGDLPLQTLTLKRGVTQGPSILSIAQLVETGLWRTRLLRKDILVCTLDDNGAPTQVWTANNAYLESWSWDNIKGDSNDVLIETMTFKYSSLIYVPL